MDRTAPSAFLSSDSHCKSNSEKLIPGLGSRGILALIAIKTKTAMHTADSHYKKAFDAYMRNGIPIELSLKQSHPTTRYIWRTQGDGKVRPSHAANDGKIFAWDDPPPTGHPGRGLWLPMPG